MSTIKIKDRTGKDLLEYMNRGMIDTKLATIWAIENFVLIDGKPVDALDIQKLNDRAYLLITSKLFPMNVDAIVTEDNEGVHYKEFTIKTKQIHRDFITQIQTEYQKKSNSNKIELIKTVLVKFYDTSIKDIESLPYVLVAYMINKANFFLAELTSDRSEFSIDDVWDTPPASTTSDELVRVV
jgi:hypothetical protein